MSAATTTTTTTTTTTGNGSNYNSDFDGVNSVPLPPLLRPISTVVSRKEIKKETKGRLVLDFSETTDMDVAYYAPYYLVVAYGSELRRVSSTSVVTRPSSRGGCCVIWNNASMKIDFSVVPEGIISVTMFRKRVLLSDIFIGTGSIDLKELSFDVKQKHVVPLRNPEEPSSHPGSVVLFSTLLAEKNDLDDDDFVLLDPAAPAMDFGSDESMQAVLPMLLPILSEYLDLQSIGRLSCTCRTIRDFFRYDVESWWNVYRRMAQRELKIAGKNEPSADLIITKIQEEIVSPRLLRDMRRGIVFKYGNWLILNPLKGNATYVMTERMDRMFCFMWNSNGWFYEKNSTGSYVCWNRGVKENQKWVDNGVTRHMEHYTRFVSLKNGLTAYAPCSGDLFLTIATMDEDKLQIRMLKGSVTFEADRIMVGSINLDHFRVDY